eukprot:CAMPEP_0203744194 /NCGR_PEP_ID=MMETSP0098-20131031/348_1 /ASSEMBLY_ACC=CAM_ASM_000208 /TAXON_ID=96639 /ORGANISM=" , Strain NY0313808BC1" /LENGTH=368 /DNA_ID=CAMNT_0050631651 /DNA_START=99 /DNA_END=1205 /DNA_ORIENTATION=+
MTVLPMQVQAEDNQWLHFVADALNDGGFHQQAHFVNNENMFRLDEPMLEQSIPVGESFNCSNTFEPGLEGLLGNCNTAGLVSPPCQQNNRNVFDFSNPSHVFLYEPSPYVEKKSFCTSGKKRQLQEIVGHSNIKPEPGIKSEKFSCDPKRARLEQTKAKRGAWSKHEDTLLRVAVADLKQRNWKAIALRVPGRDHVQCLQRWQKVLKPGLVKGTWTKEEDEVLTSMVNDDNTNWGEIANRIKGRTAKQCRERWTLSLDPSINRGQWTEAEDMKILQAHEKLGNKWAEIKRFLVGRTENQVKTRYNTLSKALRKDRTVVWTVELEEQLATLAEKFKGSITLVRRHLPRKLKGISPGTLLAHCPALKKTQ